MHQSDPADGERRRLLLGALAALGAGTGVAWSALAAAADHAHAVAAADSGPAQLTFLTAAEARTVTALADCIVPGGATPGATEAGVVYFVDHVFTHALAAQAGDFRRSLSDFVAGHAQAEPQAADFSARELAARSAYLKRIDTTPFFAQLRLLTIAGLLALPSYGGNRGKRGWQLVGFVDQHAWQPPFGHYDRDYPGFVPYPPRKAGSAT